MGKGMVFNIERYATEDGKGIRTVVFLKGCKLQCRWCANPESQSFLPEILVTAATCVKCGKCRDLCPNQAITYHEGFGYITDMKKCSCCELCVQSCYMDARKVMGRTYQTEELLEILLKDEQYYRMSGGGITFSGGEPLFQVEFIRKVAEEIHKRGYNILIETCGQVPLEKIKRGAQAADFIYYDIKHMDPDRHLELTGMDNSRILQNLNWLTENYKGQLSVRYPYIPGCNSKEEEILEFLKYIKGLKNIQEIVFLPYHRLGYPKYQGLGRRYQMGDMKSLKKVQLAHLYNLAETVGVEIKIQ